MTDIFTYLKLHSSFKNLYRFNTVNNYPISWFIYKGCLETRGRSHRNYRSRMKRYLYDFWNLVDLLSYALLIAALFVRHFYIDETFTIARRMFALSLLVMYLRFLEVFLIHRKMGPTLIMIKEMVNIFLTITCFYLYQFSITLH